MYDTQDPLYIANHKLLVTMRTAKRSLHEISRALWSANAQAEREALDQIRECVDAVICAHLDALYAEYAQSPHSQPLTADEYAPVDYEDEAQLLEAELLNRA